MKTPAGQKFLGRLRKYSALGILRYRHSWVMRSIHVLAEFFEASYENEGSSFWVNGEISVIKKLRAAGPQVALDVGANIGEWTESALGHWPKCQVHAFEVAPATFDILKDRVGKRADANRCTLNCLGLSDLSGTQQMYFYPEHPEMTSFQVHSNNRVIPFDAAFGTGDEYMARTGIDLVDFLKIDVEGAEHRVLKGFSKAIEGDKIQVIQFEYGWFSIQTKVLITDYYGMLADRYWLGKIYPDGVDFVDYDIRQEQFRFANFCCVHRSRSDLRALLSS